MTALNKVQQSGVIYVHAVNHGVNMAATQTMWASYSLSTNLLCDGRILHGA